MQAPAKKKVVAPKKVPAKKRPTTKKQVRRSERSAPSVRRVQVLEALQHLDRHGWTVLWSATEHTDYEGDDWPLIVCTAADLLDPETDGSLDELRFYFEGSAVEVQVAFALAGVLVAPPRDKGDAFVVDPVAAARKSDVMELIDALRVLEKKGFTTGAAVGLTPTDGWEQMRTAADDDGAPIVFWTEEAHRTAFDERGTLREALHLQWQGDKTVIARALKTALYRVQLPATPSEAFLVR